MTAKTTYEGFLAHLSGCKTEKQLFSPLTYALLKHPDCEESEETRLEDIRGAAYKIGVRSVEYTITQWILANRDTYDKDPAGFAQRALKKSEQKKAPAPETMESVQIENVKWLVSDMIPLGEITLLGADGGTGKGIWQAQLIAYVTAGKTSGFFPKPPDQTGKVVILAGEDDPGKVLKARLMAADADISKVFVMTSDSYYMKTGRQLCTRDKELAAFVEGTEPILMILDPLQSFIPAEVEMASRNQMRNAILPLKAISAKKECATLIAVHSNKKAGVSGRMRLSDSSDLWDLSRSVLMMGKSKNDGKIYISHEKSSYSAPQQTVLMHIEGVTVQGVKTARAVFDGYTDQKDADFIEERRFRIAQTKDDASEAILNILAESKLGSMESAQLKAAVMKEIGCSERTYKGAYSDLIKENQISKRQIVKKDGVRCWFTYGFGSSTQTSEADEIQP